MKPYKFSLNLWICILATALFLSGCSAQVKSTLSETFVPRTRPQTIYVVPFTTIMVPPEVSEGLFDRFVDNLNAGENLHGLEYVILKQGIDKIDAAWLSQHDYVVGEVFAYVEEKGSSMMSIRAKSRIRLYQSEIKEPTLALDYPVEIFYEKDYQTLDVARRKLAAKISDTMAQKLKQSLAGSE